MGSQLHQDRSADSLAHLIDHLSGPLSGGARLDEIVPDEHGRIEIPPEFKTGFATAALSIATGTDDFKLTALVDQNGGQRLLPLLAFPSFTEAGGHLLLGTLDGARAINFTLTRSGTPLKPKDLPSLMRVKLLSGGVAAILQLMKREAVRLRREAASIGACRELGVAHGTILDHIGLDLGVPRFEVGTEREPDAEYRDRLRLMRSFGAATAGAVNRQLGPGLTIEEEPNAVAMAGRLISIGTNHGDADSKRAAWLERLGAAYLADPTMPPGNEQFIPTPWRKARAERAARLGQMLSFAGGAPRLLAEGVIDALDRLALLAQASGISLALEVKEPDLANAASSELGLGLVVSRLKAADRQALAQKVPGADPSDPNAIALFRHVGFAAARPAGGTKIFLGLQPGAITLDAPATMLVEGDPLEVHVSRISEDGSLKAPASGRVGGKAAQRALYKCITLQGRPPRVFQKGHAALLRPRGPALCIFIAYALVRSGGTDPFEAKLAGSGSLAPLDLRNWERVIETMRRIRPVGIAIDTWDLRSNSVRLDGQQVDPGDVRLRRGVRPWRKPASAASLPTPSRS